MGSEFRKSLKAIAWLLFLIVVGAPFVPLIALLVVHPGFWALLYLAIVSTAAWRRIQTYVSRGIPFQFRLSTMFGITAIAALLLAIFTALPQWF